MQIIAGITSETIELFNEMSLYLLLGFFIAGVLHVFLKEEMIARYLGKKSISSIVKASLLGIPLPLCSCGVIPAAIALRKSKANKGAIFSFLISTPTTGVDSILVSYTLLGGFFTIFRIIAAFSAAFFVGLCINLFCPHDDAGHVRKNENHDVCCGGEHATTQQGLIQKVLHVFSYGFGQMLRDSGMSILLGTLIGGIIAFLIPQEFIARYLGSLWLSMIVMFFVGIPMYVCSSGSVPIVLALMLKGMHPGAAFVFLLTGPASNTVSLSIIARQFGWKSTLVYLLSLIAASFFLGYAFHVLWNVFSVPLDQQMMAHSELIPAWSKVSASCVLLVMIIVSYVRARKKNL